MNLMKMMFSVILMMGTLISISAYSWINIWIGLEINLMAFLPLINADNMKQSSEVSMKYFLVQVSGSMFILFSFILSLINLGSINELISMSQLIFNSAIFLKMGAAPFHFWYPEIVEGLSWMNILILMTWQKIAPMILVMYNFQMNIYFCMIILISMTVSGIKSWNQTSIKKIMALSSINHIGWMTSTMFLNQSLWMFYFLIYLLISVTLILMFNKYNTSNMKDLFMLMNNNKTTKLFFFLNLISLGGIPPFLGFLPKWMILNNLIMNNMTLLALMMVMLTLLSLFIYLRMMMQSLIIKSYNKKMYFKSYESFPIYFLNWINIAGLIVFTIIPNMY
uniref:NADH dehydrogenase subunit 2 n=1 Tax=Illeis koebelei TaxID=420091 RepID=UPI002182241F|nr:NADH dehydrogenase subunit 2 [Illeis koebelei]UHJ19216.1 NADH dehydrogenase subunit 2 [Illeis koebelei]UVF63297.1 NADH dehydrogenase subunit 2 [Illeis koebelei]